MFVMSKRNILLPGPNGERVFLKKDCVASVPEWAERSGSPAQAASSGALVGVVHSAKLGQDSITYDTAALTKGTENWGDLNATQYGQLLAARARLAGMGGTYVL